MGVSGFLGKLFGGEERAGATVLRAYGKLPMYAEYRRLEVAPGTPTIFSRWMDEGRLTWVRSAANSEYGVLRPSRMMVRVPDTKDVVVASVWDSRDSLGRVFPFSFFVVCPLEALGASPLECWISASAIHRKFDRFHSELHSLGRGGDFYRVYKQRAIELRLEDLPDRQREILTGAAAIEAPAWFDALGLGEETKADAWFAGLLRRAQRWRTQTTMLAQSAISCPLAAGVPQAAQVAAWLAWLDGLIKKIGVDPWLIAPADTGTNPGSLHIVLRDLIPDDYQLLTTDDRAYGFVEQLASPQSSETNGGTSSDSAGATAPTGSLLTWLREHAP